MTRECGTLAKIACRSGKGSARAMEDLAATWHLIGHLQSNKAARAAKLFHSVDSVDDLALAQRLDRARAEAGAYQESCEC